MRAGYAFLWAAAACSVWQPGPASADETKRNHTLLNPTPDRLLREMSTDRPDKTESAYTVDAGRMQLETDLAVFTRDRADGVTTETLDIAPFNFKLGLAHDLDVQFVYGSYSRVETRGRGVQEHESGGGDLEIRVKRNLWGNDGGRTALAIMPFVKVPTSTLRDANDDVEGGVILPLAIELAEGVGLGLMSEVDVLRAESGGGYVATFINSATVGFDLIDKLGMYVEAFVERSVEDGAETIVTLDAGLTYAVTDNLQLDAGVNIGVTDAADDLAVFAGLSQRY